MKCFQQFTSRFSIIILLLLSADNICFAQGGIVSAMKAALENNPSVLAARDMVEASRRDLVSEQYQRFPTLSLEAEIEGHEDSEGLLRILQPLWVGGRISNAITAAGVELAIARAGLLEVQRGMMEDTAVAYAALTGLKIQIRTAQQNIEEHQRLLDLISRRTKGKISSEADVSLARARVSYALMLKEELIGEQKTAMTTLTALTLGPVETLVPVPEECLALPAPETVKAETAKASPTIESAKLSIRLAKIEKALNKSELLPKLYGRLDQELYDRAGLSNQNLDTRLGLVLESSLTGFGMSRYEQVKAAEIRINRAKRNKEAEEIEVRRSTQSLLESRETILGRIAPARERVEASGTTLASYHRQYEAGRKTWLDLLNIQQEFATARLSLESLKSSLLQNTLRLMARTGRLDRPVGLGQ